MEKDNNPYAPPIQTEALDWGGYLKYAVLGAAAGFHGVENKSNNFVFTAAATVAGACLGMLWQHNFPEKNTTQASENTRI